MKQIKEKKPLEYREDAMSEPRCLVCGEHLNKYGYLYRGKTVCRGCVEYIRSSL